jgi:hypothetical protein
MTRFFVSASPRPMLVTLAAAAAVFAGCGGGADTADASAPAAQGAPAAALAPATATSSTPVPTVMADTGPIALADMDAQAQAEAATLAWRQLQADAAEAAKPVGGPMTSADTAAEDKAAEQQARQATPAADSDAQPASAEAAAAAQSLSPSGSATRSGNRSVPMPGTMATATSTGGTSVQEAVATPRPINSTDIRLQVEADRLFSSYKWAWGMECSGQKVGAINIPEYGILGFDLGDGLGRTRFGKVPDPDNSARKVLMFRPNSGDALVSGAPRCEMTFSPSFGGKLPVNQDIWFAFGIRLKDWVPTTDEQILMQWHWSNGSIPLGPFLTLALKGGKLQIDSKANAAYPPTVASTTSRVHWTNGAVPSNVWTYFVVKARISPHTSHNPYLKVWRDGTQIVNYAGPFGYNYPEVTPYVKIGHYQWVAAYNNWISAASTKTILVRTPALINDTTGLYTEYDVRSHVQSR